jgi:hypothetical protein
MNNHKINLSSALKTAVLFIVFNRPNTTLEVFDKIRQARPLKLYVASDGLHEGNDDEKEKVAKVRKIATSVDWPCEVKTIFRDKNLGCKMAVSTAINWFFKQEDKGIILEDDCVPHLDFFAFCENLLDYYCNDERISVISGNNFQNMKWRGDASYYFSKYTHIWGWATWRRAWKHYQGDMNFWPEWKISDHWKKYKSDKIERKYWEIKFERSYAGQIDSWAYPWMASTWYKKGLTVIPNVNLVTNIGFGEDATHTKDNSNKFFKISIKGLSHIIHPNKVIINKEADKFVFDNIYRGKFLRFPYNWFIFPYRVFNYILRKIIMNKKK